MITIRTVTNTLMALVLLTTSSQGMNHSNGNQETEWPWINPGNIGHNEFTWDNEKKCVTVRWHGVCRNYDEELASLDSTQALRDFLTNPAERKFGFKGVDQNNRTILHWLALEYERHKEADAKHGARPNSDTTVIEKTLKALFCLIGGTFAIDGVAPLDENDIKRLFPAYAAYESESISTDQLLRTLAQDTFAKQPTLATLGHYKRLISSCLATGSLSPFYAFTLLYPAAEIPFLLSKERIAVPFEPDVANALIAKAKEEASNSYEFNNPCDALSFLLYHMAGANAPLGPESFGYLFQGTAGRPQLPELLLPSLASKTAAVGNSVVGQMQATNPNITPQTPPTSSVPKKQSLLIPGLALTAAACAGIAWYTTKKEPTETILNPSDLEINEEAENLVHQTDNH